jgi:hypothetical protein
MCLPLVLMNGFSDDAGIHGRGGIKHWRRRSWKHWTQCVCRVAPGVDDLPLLYRCCECVNMQPNALGATGLQWWRWLCVMAGVSGGKCRMVVLLRGLQRIPHYVSHALVSAYNTVTFVGCGSHLADCSTRAIQRRLGPLRLVMWLNTVG